MFTHIWLLIYGYSYMMNHIRSVYSSVTQHTEVSALCCLKGTRLDVYQAVLTAPIFSLYPYMCSMSGVCARPYMTVICD